MRESSYVATFSAKLEEEEGGKVYKISDKATLGLPDSFHIKNGIVTYFETKVSEDIELIENVYYAQPWKIVKKDLRQYEVCRQMARNALVVYCIYWPNIKMSTVLTTFELSLLRSENDKPFLYLDPSRLEVGHGVPALQRLMKRQREEIYATLKYELGTNA